MNLSFFVRENSGEQVIYELRRHPFTFIPQIILFIFLLGVPIVLYFLFENMFPRILVTTHPLYAVFVLLSSSYYLAVVLFFFGMFIDFYLDLWIVTNNRIIDVEQHGLLSRSVSEIELFRIQDVTTNITGLFPTMLHFGDVIVKTASNTTGIVFRNVHKPNFIRSELIRLAELDRKNHVDSHVIEVTDQ